MSTVTVYTRPGCHLCEEAMGVIERARARRDFELVVVDIESDDALMLRYLERIPVVAIDGQERFEFFVDEDAFAASLGIVGAP